MPYGECTSRDMDVAHAADVKVAFSLKDIFLGKELHYTNRTISNGAEEEQYFRERVSKFRTHREPQNISLLNVFFASLHSNYGCDALPLNLQRHSSVGISTMSSMRPIQDY